MNVLRLDDLRDAYLAPSHRFNCGNLSPLATRHKFHSSKSPNASISSKRAVYQDIIKISLEKFKENRTANVRALNIQNSSNEKPVRKAEKSPNFIVRRISEKGWVDPNHKKIIRAHGGDPGAAKSMHRIMSRTQFSNSNERLPPFNNFLGIGKSEKVLRKDNSNIGFLQAPSMQIPSKTEIGATPKNLLKVSFGTDLFEGKGSTPTITRVDMNNFNDFYTTKLKVDKKPIDIVETETRPSLKKIAKKVIFVNKVRDEFFSDPKNMNEDLRSISKSFFKSRNFLLENNKLHENKVTTPSKLRRSVVHSHSRQNSSKDNSLSMPKGRELLDKSNPHSLAENTRVNLKFSMYFTKFDASAHNLGFSNNKVVSMMSKDFDDNGELENSKKFGFFRRDSSWKASLIESDEFEKNMDIMIVAPEIKIINYISLFAVISKCPFGVVGQSPRALKAPYVYEFSNQFDYSSYWLDCITRLCGESNMTNTTNFGFYGVEDYEEQKIVGVEEELRSLVTMMDKVVHDINHEHEEFKKSPSNQFLNL
jgi:hypothetical protein